MSEKKKEARPAGGTAERAEETGSASRADTTSQNYCTSDQDRTQAGYDRAYRWTMAVGGRAGLSVDDFEQGAFLALLEALEGWEDRGGSFLTWYGLKLRGAFSEASGQRTKRDQLDPIQSAVSLETPLVDREGDLLYLEDVIPDPRAEEALESIGEWEALHRAVDGLPEHQRTVIRRRYWLEQKVDHKIHAAALRALRHPRNSRELRAYF